MGFGVCKGKSLFPPFLYDLARNASPSHLGALNFNRGCGSVLLRRGFVPISLLGGNSGNFYPCFGNESGKRKRPFWSYNRCRRTQFARNLNSSSPSTPPTVASTSGSVFQSSPSFLPSLHSRCCIHLIQSFHIGKRAVSLR